MEGVSVTVGDVCLDSVACDDVSVSEMELELAGVVDHLDGLPEVV